MANLPVKKQARALDVQSRPPSKRWRSNSNTPESCAYCADASPSSSISLSSAPSPSENAQQLVDLSDITTVASSTAADANTVVRTAANASPRWNNNNKNNNIFTISNGYDSNKNKKAATPELPDEVLVAVLRFVPSAATLWSLRAVCRRWRNIIDTRSSVWRDVSFKGLLLNRPVVISPSPSSNNTCNTKVLTLGPRQGATAVHLAAGAGNEWASFLSMCLFDCVPLKALTVVQPVANSLVSDNNYRRFETRERPNNNINNNNVECGHGWVVIHAARRGPQEFPRGALVGMIRVGGTVQNGNQWIWKIEETVKLVKPLRCAGYVGLWSLSRPLTEILVRALHTQ